MTETAEEMKARLARAHAEAQMKVVGGIPPHVPTRAGRAGDSQPLPVESDTPVIFTLVKHDLDARMQLGIERYGQPLQAHNGRDALRDAYEEALDLCVYLRQAIYEKENPK